MLHPFWPSVIYLTTFPALVMLSKPRPVSTARLSSLCCTCNGLVFPPCPFSTPPPLLGAAQAVPELYVKLEPRLSSAEALGALSASELASVAWAFASNGSLHWDCVLLQVLPSGTTAPCPQACKIMHRISYLALAKGLEGGGCAPAAAPGSCL